MPTHSETIPNKALSGAELRQILIDDFMRLISQDSMLADHLAYGRIAYDITVRLHVDNPFTVGIPHSSKIASKWVGRNVVEAAPEMAAIENFPLQATSDEAIVQGEQLARNIDSPNRERLRMGMPVPVNIQQRDGSTRTENVQYPPTEDEGDVKVSDVTAEVAAALKAFEGK